MAEMRRLILDGQTYLWRRSHSHPLKSVASCVETLVVYLEGHKKAPLRLVFHDIDELGWTVGRDAKGVLVPPRAAGEGGEPTNLNRPAVVEKLVRRALASGWRPAREVRPTEILSPFDWLR